MRTLLAVAVTLALIIALPAACLATVELYAWLQSQSPDGRMIEVNGYIGSSDATIIDWVYAWGDGTANTGWFPMVHRYGWPGEFTVTVTGYDDTGDTTIAQLPISVPESYPTDVVFILCEPGCWSIKDTDSLEVRLFAFDADWNRVSMEGRWVDVYYPGAADFVDVEVRDSTLMVTAESLGTRDYAWSSIFPYVDGQRSLSAVDLMTNKHPGDFIHRHIAYVGSYLPDTFFAACSLDIDEYTHINDLAFNADMATTYGRNPNQGDRSEFQGISYAPSAYGMSGNPIGIGDYTLPVNGRPHFDVIFHEMGHNFAGVNLLFISLGSATPFYGETIAEWYVQYGINDILANHSGEISGLAVSMLEGLRDENRAYHLSEYDNYISGGCEFDYYDISSSHAMVEMIYEYCDIYGWDKLTRCMDFFGQDKIYDYGQIIGNAGGITDEVHRVTFLLAALSYAFSYDVRPDFALLNFPVDDDLFNALLGLWGAGVPGDGLDPNGSDGSGPVARLYQNRPNPATGGTEITYWLGREMEVDLGLYDVQGRAVATLDRGVRAAGLNRARLDCSSLSPGVYFCELTAGGLIERRKIVIAR
jgi:hypothetical protein